MNNSIKELTEKLFENIPYSAETEKMKYDILNSLNEEYEKDLKDLNDIQALGRIMRDYGTFNDAARLAGYEEDKAEEIQLNDDAVCKKDFISYFRKLKWNIYICSISFIYFCTSLINFIFIDTSLLYIISLLISAAITSLFAFRFIRRKNKIKYVNIKLMPESRKYLNECTDKYIKDLFNSLLFSIAILFYFVFISLVSFFNIGLNSGEVFTSVWVHVSFFQLVGYIVLKNILCLNCLNSCYSTKRTKLFKKHEILLVSASILYWIISVVILLILKEEVDYVYNYFGLFLVLYIIACAVYNLTMRKSIVFKNLVINKKRITIVSICALAFLSYQVMQMDSWLLQPYISTISSVQYTPDDITYDEKTGIYTITSNKEDFKILQLTDIHLGGSAFSAMEDYQALKACYDLIEYTKPDFVIVTGDLVFAVGVMSFSLNNSSPIMQFASFMRNVGIPWAFTYGNHDTESISKSSKEEINELFKSFSFKTSKSLLYPYIQPDITGRNNQLIELRRTDGSLNQALFLIDSNDYTEKGMNDYDYIHDDQVTWYEEHINRLNAEENKTISSMLFFHIPLQQYRTANDLYEQGNSEVKYYFGENKETMINKVCCSDYPSKLFDTAIKLGSTKAMFCGHDHYNNLSVEYQGIRLTYGMSIDYLAMPGIEKDLFQRGGTLITINSDSSFDIEQVRLLDIQGNNAKRTKKISLHN